MPAKLQSGLQGSCVQCRGSDPTMWEEMRQGMANLNHPAGQGLWRAVLHWYRLQGPEFRKGRDDGDWRLGWRGNSGTSRHQPLLSVATHILFLSTTLSWGQCPSWRGQE